MTISYSQEVATVRGIGVLYRLLPRWMGSVYKLIWKELVLYCFAFGVISIVSRLFLNKNEDFRHIISFCRGNMRSIPVTFFLGFYLSLIMSRWWEQLLLFPWPEPVCFYILGYVEGTDARGRKIRRTLARWVNLTFVLVISMISHKVSERYPTLEDLVEAGWIAPHEKAVFDLANESNSQAKWYIPLMWCMKLISRAREENRITSSLGKVRMHEVIQEYQKTCINLLNYDLINIPFVYTQLTTIVVYFYFAVNVLADQHLPEEDVLDYYLPILSVLELIFYFGLLKVGECLLNPYGRDDEDIEVNWIIDRNFKISYFLVDEILRSSVEPCSDKIYKTYHDRNLPYWFGTVVNAPADRGPTVKNRTKRSNKHRRYSLV